MSSKRAERGLKDAKWQRVSLTILRAWVRASQVANQKKLFLLLFNRIMKYQKSRKKITSKIYNQLTRSEPNWLLLAQSKINPSKKSDFPAVAQKEGDKCKRCWNGNSSFECFLILGRELNFCAITEIMGTDTKKSRRINR